MDSNTPSNSKSIVMILTKDWPYLAILDNPEDATSIYSNLYGKGNQTKTCVIFVCCTFLPVE